MTFSSGRNSLQGLASLGSLVEQASLLPSHNNGAMPPRPTALARRLGGPVPGMVLLFAAQSFAFRLLDTMSSSGFVGHVGTLWLPWLWFGNMLLTLAAGSVFLRVADRLTRVHLLAALLLGSCAAYAALALSLHVGFAPGRCYTALYTLSSLQVSLLPIASWTLATDLFPVHEAKRAFPPIVAGDSIGQLLGYGASALVASHWGSGLRTDVRLLLLSAVLCAVSAMLVRALFTGGRAPTSAPRESVREALRLVREVPVFRYLSAAVVLVWIAQTCFSFHVLVVIDRATAQNASHYRTLYAIYNIGTSLVVLLTQALLAGPLLARTPLRSAFLVLPAVLLLGSAVAGLLPGLAGGFGVSVALYIASYAWDTPARHALLGTVPLSSRGGVTTLIDNHAYAMGCLVGSALLGGLLWVCGRMHLPWRAVTAGYLGLSGLASLGAVWAALRLRSSYATSMKRGVLLGVRGLERAP